MPALSHERLSRQLRDGARGGLFLLTGAEEHLREAAAREVIAAHLDDATRDFNLDEVRGSDVTAEALGSLIQTPPMMAEWRVVVVRDAQSLGASASLRGILETTAAAPPPGLALVLVADLSASKAKVWDAVRKAATVVDFPRLADADVPGWLMEWASAAGLRMEPAAARALATAIGAELGILVREMEKLRDYVADRGVIDRDDVARIVGAIPREDRWEWIDTVAERRFDRARAALPVLLDAGESGVGLVAGLANQFLRIGLHIAGGRSALEAQLPPRQKWLARRIDGQARGWSVPTVDRALDHLRRADRLLKSAPLTQLQVMEELLLRIQHELREAA